MDDFRGYSRVNPPTALLPHLPTMRRSVLFLAVIVLCVAAPLQAADGLALFPPTVTLDGLDARQQLVLTETAGGKQADQTTTAVYSTSAPGVAIVSPAGVVTPVGDGEAIITATAANKSAAMIVTVKNATAAKPVTFERDIQPILTRSGCNAGACHGKARGQNGFQLSLLAYDNDFDFNAITTEARGRRIFPANPELQPALCGSRARRCPTAAARSCRREASITAWWRSGSRPAVRERPATRPSSRASRSSPPNRSMVFGASQQLAVTAHYSDGSTRDVTHLAQFSSSESVYAAVDANGRVKAGPIPGEAAIMARFAEKFAVCDRADSAADARRCGRLRQVAAT